PTTSTLNAVPRPTISDTWVPTISLLKESRPDSSHPKGWAPDGGAYVSHALMAFGLYGVHTSETSATTTSSPMQKTAISASLLRRSRRQPSIQRLTCSRATVPPAYSCCWMGGAVIVVTISI